jgi:hypothetical protein
VLDFDRLTILTEILTLGEGTRNAYILVVNTIGRRIVQDV